MNFPWIFWQGSRNWSTKISLISFSLLPSSGKLSTIFSTASFKVIESLWPRTFLFATCSEICIYSSDCFSGSRIFCRDCWRDCCLEGGGSKETILFYSAFSLTVLSSFSKRSWRFLLQLVCAEMKSLSLEIKFSAWTAFVYFSGCIRLEGPASWSFRTKPSPFTASTVILPVSILVADFVPSISSDQTMASSWRSFSIFYTRMSITGKVFSTFSTYYSTASTICLLVCICLKRGGI